MKAAIVETPGQLAVRQIAQPAHGEYGALCQLLFGATCGGTDQHLIAGHAPFCYWVKSPFILGHESIGRVVETGSKVRNLKVGDLVTRVGAPATADLDIGWGGFAEFGVARDWQAMEADGVPRPEWNGARVNQRLPPGTDPAAATMVITWRETLSYLKRMGFAAGKSLLVVGSGGNGLAFARHAANLGGATVAMIGSGARGETSRRAGATVFADYRDRSAVERIREACPDGYDVAIDAIGTSDASNQALSLLRPGGMLGTYGMDDPATLRLNPAAARGTFTVNKAGYDEAETHAEVVRNMQEGRLDAALWFDAADPFPLDGIHAAFQAVASRRVVKALVRLAPE